MENKIEQLKQGFDDISKNLEFSINDYLSEEDYKNFLDARDSADALSDLRSLLEDKEAFDVKIIYHSNAIEYLSNNDPSLLFSLELASEFGYTTKNLNSEILASLLASANSRDSFSDQESEIEELFNKINSEI